MDELKLEILIDRYNTSVKGHMNEIERPNGIMANYFIDMANSLQNKDKITEKDIVEESHNYAWDLSPWFKDPYPYKLFDVYSYYEAYSKLSHEEKQYIKQNK